MSRWKKEQAAKAKLLEGNVVLAKFREKGGFEHLTLTYADGKEIIIQGGGYEGELLGVELVSNSLPGKCVLPPNPEVRGA